MTVININTVGETGENSRNAPEYVQDNGIYHKYIGISSDRNIVIW